MASTKAPSRTERRARYDADTARLKALGGRARSEVEEREFKDIFLRDPGRCVSYFEKRLWEKCSATA